MFTKVNLKYQSLLICWTTPCPSQGLSQFHAEPVGQYRQNPLLTQTMPHLLRWVSYRAKKFFIYSLNPWNWKWNQGQLLVSKLESTLSFAQTDDNPLFYFIFTVQQLGDWRDLAVLAVRRAGEVAGSETASTAALGSPWSAAPWVAAQFLSGFKHHLNYLCTSSQQQQKMLPWLCISVLIKRSIACTEFSKDTRNCLVFIGNGFWEVVPKVQCC